MQSTLVLLPLLLACSGADTPPPAAAAPASVSTKDDYDTMLGAAEAYLGRGNPAGAAKAASRAAAAKPDAPEPHILWGRALAQQSQLEAAAERYEEARRLGSRDRRLFMELASVYDVSGKYADAIQIYRDFLTDHVDDREMRHELGLSLLLAGQYDAAVTELEKVVAAAGSGLQAREDLGYALLGAGKLEAAERELEAVLQGGERATTLQLLAQLRLAQGRRADAIALLDRAVQASRTNPAPVRLRARIKSLDGDHEGALSDYQLLTRANADDASAWLGASGALAALERLDEAEAAADKARSIAGDNAAVRFRVAQIAWRRGDSSAVDNIETFARDNPESLEAWRELALAASRTGNKKLAKEAKAKVRAIEKAGVR